MYPIRALSVPYKALFRVVYKSHPATNDSAFVLSPVKLVGAPSRSSVGRGAELVDMVSGSGSGSSGFSGFGCPDSISGSLLLPSEVTLPGLLLPCSSEVFCSGTVSFCSCLATSSSLSAGSFSVSGTGS